MSARLRTGFFARPVRAGSSGVRLASHHPEPDHPQPRQRFGCREVFVESSFLRSDTLCRLVPPLAYLLFSDQTRRVRFLPLLAYPLPLLPGLEICCGCIPPSDNVAMDHTSPLPLPNPGPARSDREPDWRDQPGKMKGRAQSFSLSKLSKFPHNKKAGPRRNQNACEGRCEARLRERPHRGGRKKEKKNPPKNGSSPLAFDGALRESPPGKNQDLSTGK